MGPIKIAGLAPNGIDFRATISNVIIEPVGVLPVLDDETTHLLVEVSAQPVIVTFDGSSPTTTNGHVFIAGYREWWSKPMFLGARWLRQGATDAVVHVSQFAYI